MNTTQNQTQIDPKMLTVKKLSKEEGTKWYTQHQRNINFELLWGIYQGDRLLGVTDSDPQELLQ